MSKIVSLLNKDKRGVTALEYGLIASLVAVAIASAVGILGGDLAATFTSVYGHLVAAPPT